MRFFRILVVLSLFSATFFSQTTPFLSLEEAQMLRNEISGDRSFEHIRVLSRWHRDSGMEGYFKALDYVAETAKENGLADVSIIKQPFVNADGSPRNYTAKSAELWIVEPFELKLADIGDHALYLSDNSRDADITAELVWAGDASDKEFEGRDVKGKIVLANANAGFAVSQAVYKHGAAGVVVYTTSESKSVLDFPDQLPWTRIPDPPAGKSGTFSFNLSPRKGDTLRQLLETNGMQDLFATGKRTPGGKVRLRAKVDTLIGTENKNIGTGMVEGWIRGTKYKDQQIVITAHLQEEQGSANDDGSGSGNILELARVFSKLIREGKIKPPLRDIRFWWTDEISSEYRYFRDNPGSEKSMLANLHQDMTGAKQSIGSRVQHLIFNPHSRTSYLDALFESVGNYVILTNNPFIQAGRQGGYPRPHSQPIYSTRGSREGYNARFVPYFGSSDNLVFVEGKIAVPSVAMVNWDDYYIHSSDDDLDKLDQTQLQRNNFIIAAMAFYLAYAEANDIPALASETYSQGQRRLAHDLSQAFRLIGEKEDGLAMAQVLVRQGIKREIRALESMRVIADKNADANRVIDRLIKMVESGQSKMQSDIAEFARAKNVGSETTSTLIPASSKVPENIASTETYFQKRARIRTGLHPAMSSEVMNFVDGNRSYSEICEAVMAESLSAGPFFYGTVDCNDVYSLLDANVKSGALRLKTE
ncbi:MAG: PA domain-containing protein [Pyrinomonadaceae bacterium]